MPAGLGIVLATIGLTALPAPLAAAPCDAVIGEWTWFTNGVVTINRDGTIVHNPGNTGTWECTDPVHNRFTVRWRVGGLANAMVLSPDGRRLTSTDPAQQFVTASRRGEPPSMPAAVPPPSNAQPSPAPDETDAFVQGRKLAESGRCAQAIPYFDKAIQANPRYAKAYSDRGRCLARLGKMAQGLQDLDRAVASAPDEMSPWFNRASLRADAGDGDGALADLDLSVRNDPMNPASRVARAGLLQAMGRAAESKQDADLAYRQIAALEPRKRGVADLVLKTWRNKRVRMSPPPSPGTDPAKAAAVLARAHRYRAAIAALDAALGKSPRDEKLLLARGRMHLEIGQANQALSDLSAALELRPSAEGLVRRGLAYRQLCRFRDEVADYDRALRLDPRFTQAYFERAFTNLFFDKRLDAIPDLTRVIQLDPKNWLAYNFRGELYRYWVKLAPAIADFRQAVALNPGYAQPYCNMAFALRAARRMNEVDAWLRKCYALDPAEREVADRVFADIQAKEEQAARDMAAMRHWSGGGGHGGGGGSEGGGAESGPGCSYTSYGACNAEAAGDRWAAERIEYGRSDPSETDWYSR
jgi:tetratricopeptide (TPR) repeat protein